MTLVPTGLVLYSMLFRSTLAIVPFKHIGIQCNSPVLPNISDNTFCLALVGSSCPLRCILCPTRAIKWSCPHYVFFPALHMYSTAGCKPWKPSKTKRLISFDCTYSVCTVYSILQVFSYLYFAKVLSQRVWQNFCKKRETIKKEYFSMVMNYSNKDFFLAKTAQPGSKNISPS